MSRIKSMADILSNVDLYLVLMMSLPQINQVG